MEIKSLEIDNNQIKYKLIKSTKAVRIRLQISPGGLELIIPDKIDFQIAQNFLDQNKDWLKRNLSKLANPKYFYLGREIFIQHQIDMFGNEPILRHESEHLIVSAKADYEFDADQIYDYWLKHKAKKYLPNRVEYFARKFDFQFKRVTIRNQRTRWGSCSSKGNLSFNFYLMKHNKKVIDYVIVHELCHLKEMNHSKRFWKLVEEIIPDYKRFRKQLKGFL